jgi:hypothetical protein
MLSNSFIVCCRRSSPPVRKLVRSLNSSSPTSCMYVVGLDNLKLKGEKNNSFSVMIKIIRIPGTCTPRVQYKLRPMNQV